MGRRNREINTTEEIYESQGPGKNRYNFLSSITCPYCPFFVCTCGSIFFFFFKM